MEFMKKEFGKRIVHETILEKVENINRAQEVKLSQLDFWNPEMGTPTLLISHVPELVILLENDTDGRLKLISTTPVKTGVEITAPNNIVPDPDYKIMTDFYRISYNPNTSLRKSANTKEDPYLFYLSRTDGLYRIFHGERQTYPAHLKAGLRFLILESLSSKFQKTEDLAKETRTDAQKLRTQIAGIRKMIEKHFEGITGERFIEGGQGQGYRIGKDFNIKRR